MGNRVECPCPPGECAKMTSETYVCRKRDARRYQLLLCIAQLVNEADKEGFTVNVDQIPLLPLAMSNYDHVITVQHKFKREVKHD